MNIAFIHDCHGIQRKELVIIVTNHVIFSDFKLPLICYIEKCKEFSLSIVNQLIYD